MAVGAVGGLTRRCACGDAPPRNPFAGGERPRAQLAVDLPVLERDALRGIRHPRAPNTATRVDAPARECERVLSLPACRAHAFPNPLWPLETAAAGTSAAERWSSSRSERAMRMRSQATVARYTRHCPAAWLLVRTLASAATGPGQSRRGGILPLSAQGRACRKRHLHPLPTARAQRHRAEEGREKW
jgi:hypothetical protein